MKKPPDMPKKRISIPVPLVFAILFVFGVVTAHTEEERKFTLSGLSGFGKKVFTLPELDALGAEGISSAYFDRAMGYKGSRLRAISFSRLMAMYHPPENADAALLNCFDDYQGIISLAEIERYKIRLATRIDVLPEFARPGWLNALLVVVPDGSDAPYQERFMTANIREIRFIRLEDYYNPLQKIAQTSARTQNGFQIFQDNCLFCHSLKGIGGNKGVRLLETYDFSGLLDRERFMKDFSGFHNKDNADKQNIEQFVSRDRLKDVAEFLLAVKSAGEKLR